MTFKELNIIEPVLRAIKEMGHFVPTPIQKKAIPAALTKQDILGCAQTGTGKTAAFVIPIIQNLLKDRLTDKQKGIGVLILSPTRELALQTSECVKEYAKYTNLKHSVIFGGVNQLKQTNQLRQGVDILIATPGRLLDLISQRYINLNTVKYFVLDEADRMLDMGFINDIRKILPMLTSNRQTLCFSATMPEEMLLLARTMLRNPIKIEIDDISVNKSNISQFVYYVEKKDKNNLLIKLLEESENKSVIVFSQTKHNADKIVRVLKKAGIGSEAIHGNKSQNARQNALSNFKSGKTRVMVATDIASRGIDIQELPLVINYDLPNVAETYVHRIGRTGRAGHNGTALSFCSSNEYDIIRNIQKLTGKKINRATLPV